LPADITGSSPRGVEKEELAMQRVLSGIFVACLVAAATVAVRSATARADDDSRSRADCRGLPDASALRQFLQAAPDEGGQAGGLFEGRRMWGALVNRAGELCAFTTSTGDRTQVWPGSQAIAKSKAYTANAFSLDALALSTARLYTFTQPGHSLWSLGHSNLFDTDHLQPPRSGNDGRGGIPGGQIFFGGGVPLYNEAGAIVGGLGVSGDTSCTDHEIAKRVRTLAGLNPPGGPLVDDITYSSVDDASVFTHPLCVNTWRNGVFIGNEAAASGY
jgi:uncharacterized protein GlcG (DUF336 family)